MSERNVPPRHNDSDPLDSAARADQTPAIPPSTDSDAESWEVVPLAGLPELSAKANEPVPDSSSAHDKTADLHNRIHDLNRCNEVLLARVNQLEEALERSQQALQQEVERSHHPSTEAKVAAAQNHSVAELLRDLEQSNAALERQTILSETLTAQLQTYQERSEQLEKECTILRQQHAKTSQRLQSVEDTCTDLRSRLQRQQRYTLQFKAALEKCLDTSAFHHTSSRIEADIDVSNTYGQETPSTINPMVMPRSERIQPWSASESAAHTDPNLLSLVRSRPLNATAEPTSASVSHPFPTSLAGPTSPTPETETPDSDVAAEATNHEAEQQLWQDVERVIDNTANAADAETIPETSTATVASSEHEVEAAETSPFTEPIPWGAPVAKAAPESAADFPEAVAASPSDSRNHDIDGDAPIAAAKAQDSASDPVTDKPNNDRPTASFAASIPALDAMNTPQASPSPVVHPLKPSQRKRKSLSAVELPSFPPLPKVNG